MNLGEHTVYRVLMKDAEKKTPNEILENLVGTIQTSKDIKIPL